MESKERLPSSNSDQDIDIAVLHPLRLRTKDPKIPIRRTPRLLIRAR
jgi:hypothetical protein